MEEENKETNNAFFYSNYLEESIKEMIELKYNIKAFENLISKSDVLRENLSNSKIQIQNSIIELSKLISKHVSSLKIDITKETDKKVDRPDLRRIVKQILWNQSESVKDLNFDQELTFSDKYNTKKLLNFDNWKESYQIKNPKNGISWINKYIAKFFCLDIQDPMIILGDSIGYIYDFDLSREQRIKPIMEVINNGIKLKLNFYRKNSLS